MQQKTIVISIALFIVIVAGMFGFAYLKKNEAAKTPVAETPSNTQATTTPYDSITRIMAKHFFVNGTHTLAGEIAMPTPCDLLESNARVMESMPEQVIVDFTVINTAKTCAQQVTPQRFKVSVQASENATFKATFMGRPVDLNLVPAGTGESPDDFELFVKG